MNYFSNQSLFLFFQVISDLRTETADQVDEKHFFFNQDVVFISKVEG
jgi:hypothetical protein